MLNTGLNCDNSKFKLIIDLYDVFVVLLLGDGCCVSCSNFYFLAGGIVFWILELDQVEALWFEFDLRSDTFMTLTIVFIFPGGLMLYSRFICSLHILASYLNLFCLRSLRSAEISVVELVYPGG